MATARVIVDCGLTNAYLVENLNATVGYWRQLPLGRSEHKLRYNAQIATWDGSAYATNTTVLTNNSDAVFWLEVRKLSTGGTWQAVPAVYQRAEVPASDKPYVSQRYAVVALFMLLGLVACLCYQAGRKGGK